MHNTNTSFFMPASFGIFPRRSTRSRKTSRVMLACVIDPASFKAYDVRGIYPAQLDEEGAYAIGRAYVDQFSPSTIAVGRDMRVSGVTMAEAVCNGAADAGAQVDRKSTRLNSS